MRTEDKTMQRQMMMIKRHKALAPIKTKKIRKTQKIKKTKKNGPINPLPGLQSKRKLKRLIHSLKTVKINSKPNNINKTFKNLTIS